MGGADANKLPLGDRSERKKKIRDLADLYAETNEAKERLSAVRAEFSSKCDEADFDNFGSWTQFELEEPVTELPLLVTLPFDQEALENLDPDTIDAVSQKYFWMKKSTEKSIRPFLDVAKYVKQEPEIKTDPDEKIVIRDGCVMRLNPSLARKRAFGGGDRGFQRGLGGFGSRGRGRGKSSGGRGKPVQRGYGRDSSGSFSSRRSPPRRHSCTRSLTPERRRLESQRHHSSSKRKRSRSPPKSRRDSSPVPSQRRLPSPTPTHGSIGSQSPKQRSKRSLSPERRRYSKRSPSPTTTRRLKRSPSPTFLKRSKRSPSPTFLNRSRRSPSPGPVQYQPVSKRESSPRKRQRSASTEDKIRGHIERHKSKSHNYPISAVELKEPSSSSKDYRRSKKKKDLPEVIFLSDEDSPPQHRRDEDASHRNRSPPPGPSRLAERRSPSPLPIYSEKKKKSQKSDCKQS